MYVKLITESKIGTLAVKVAGCSVIEKCTVSSCRDLPGLPVNEVNTLKVTLFSLFPIIPYHSIPVTGGQLVLHQLTNHVNIVSKKKTVCTCLLYITVSF